jgi:hypothetical protein
VSHCHWHAGKPIHKAPGAVSVKDLEVNPAESIQKQYSDMVLWTETARTNAKVFGAAEKQLTRAAAVKDGPDMRDLYMGQVTEAFGDELDKLRTVCVVVLPACPVIGRELATRILCKVVV